MYKYSFIVASRNDNHGGNMRDKNIFFINRWLHSIKKYNSYDNLLGKNEIKFCTAALFFQFILLIFYI